MNDDSVVMMAEMSFDGLDEKSGKENDCLFSQGVPLSLFFFT